MKSGHYNGTIFHRVIPGFMIQGGGFTQDMRAEAHARPIKNEADNGLKNDTGTVAMARTQRSAFGDRAVLHQRDDNDIPQLHAPRRCAATATPCSAR